MNLAGARRSISEAFCSAGIDNAEADLILIRLLCVPRAFIFGHPEKILTVNELSLIDDIVARRLAGEPAGQRARRGVIVLRCAQSPRRAAVFMAACNGQ